MNAQSPMVTSRTWILVTLVAAVIAGAGSHLTKVLVTPGAVPPIGTIVAYYGDVAEIPEGWVLCDGENECPDLTDHFIRGTTNAGIRRGGAEEHAHQWVRRGSGQQLGVWYSYRTRDGNEQTVDSWDESGRTPGIGSSGSGTYPFIATAGSALFTSPEENLPLYVELRYIMRVR